MKRVSARETLTAVGPLANPQILPVFSVKKVILAGRVQYWHAEVQFIFPYLGVYNDIANLGPESFQMMLCI